MPWPAVVMMSPMMIAAKGFADKKSNVQLALLLFNYPAILFLLLYLTGYSFYGTNPFSWAGVMAALGILICIIYGLPRQFLNVSRGISNYDYFIRERNVYLNGKRIQGADPNTFTHFDNRGYYSKDKSHVYYDTRRLASADAATFKPLAKDDEARDYWHDKNNAYYKWHLIEGADGSSFTFAGYNYAFDKSNVFFEHQLLKDVDRATFQVLKNFVARDAKNVYVRDMQATNIKDVDTFQMVTMAEESFGRDKDQIYTLRYTPPNPLLPFPNADVETFEVIGDYYAKDKNRVYYYSYHVGDILVVEGANPKTFALSFDHSRGTNATDGERHYKAGVLYQEKTTA